MKKRITATTPEGLYVGLDLGDRYTHYCLLDVDGTVQRQGRFPTTAAHFTRLLAHAATVALEVGPQSPWVSRLLAGAGHAVLVANPRRLKLIYGTGRKNDRLDAERLARLARLDPVLLHPIQHRSAAAQADLCVVRARQNLVAARTKLINAVRGLCKSVGVALPGCSAPAFPARCAPLVPPALTPALAGLLEQIAALTTQIGQYDRQIATLGAERYPATARLQAVRGVGPLTALTFVLTLDDPTRFRHSRMVGAWLGLTPQQDDSGDTTKQLPITKQGDAYLRQLLVQCAHYILGPFGEDCALRRYGERIAAQGGPKAKKRAAVAVARKLAVLLHQVWVSDTPYDPERGALAPAA